MDKISKLFYQKNIILWARDRLGVAENTLNWVKNPEYREKGYVDEHGNYTDKWDGTPNPFKAIEQSIVNWEDTAVESASGCSKTFFAAITTLWFLDVWGDEDPDHDCIVLTFGSKGDQLKVNLWKEIQRFWPRFKKYHPQAEMLELQIRMRPDRKNWNAHAYTAGTSAGEDVNNKAAGFHAKYMLVILEECPGIQQSVMDTLSNTCVGDYNIRLGLGNPEGTTDTLHKFTVLETTTSIRISAYDYPNVVCENSDLIPGAVTIKSIKKRLAEFKLETHPTFASKVRGICPNLSDKSKFQNEVIEFVLPYLIEPILYRDINYSFSSGWLKVYEFPEKIKPFPNSPTIYNYDQKNNYIVFADLAGDSGDGDYHVGTVLRRTTRSVEAILRMRGPREDFIGELLKLCEEYKVIQGNKSTHDNIVFFYPCLAWEKVGVGDIILDPRIKSYPNLYRSRPLNSTTSSIQSNVGWSTNSSTRDTMIDEIESWSLELLDFPERLRSQDLLEEMKVFVKNRRGKYEAAAGHHDDMVMSLAGALTIHKVLNVPRFNRLNEGKRKVSNIEKLIMKNRNSNKDSWDRSFKNNWDKVSV